MALPSYHVSNANLDIWGNGLCPGQIQRSPYAATHAEEMNPVKQTLSPIVTGTSVLGVAVKDGILLAADTLGSYGSSARFKNCSRVMKVNESTVLAAGGDVADFQYLKTIIEQRVNDENCYDDGFNYNPRSLFSWLTRVMYNRRSKYDPLWNTFAIGGMHEGKPFLGYVDKIGIAYTSDTLATGFGAYLARPILRDALEKNPDMSMSEAKTLIMKAMKILFYRDARSLNKFEIVSVTKDGATIEGPLSAKVDWSIANLICGYE
ncbi:proteasome subunit beta type-4 [Octopus bimaculoides]|uniref:Proteasome subunit beta n=1 Tax=Octopus bimaculoides TaxID=37653 RepID=A0A0L8GUS7_OCTBM|nr:proteasome subunit beta type-4 [Octopus bimaculoides]|eukprot:XP_014777892.1 PREDICTED: proteasome subunit beta type-4-like [Octopus bimaculoides]